MLNLRKVVIFTTDTQLVKDENNTKYVAMPVEIEMPVLDL